jgi:hypothetical protein
MLEYGSKSNEFPSARTLDTVLTGAKANEG